MRFEFGDYAVDVAAREVRRNDELIEVEPRAFELLVYLLEHRERAVGKDELQEKVWGTIVSDSALTRCVMKLRKSLGGEPEAVIKTVPRFGYRFVAPLAGPETPDAPRQENRADRTWLVLLAIAAMLAVPLALWWFSPADRPVIQKSVAVLPFSDLSETQDQAWLADGLAEEILNALARTPDLAVASRTSSFAYRNSSQSVSSIAADLGVAHILEGSVRRSDGRVRVTAQLIRAQDGFHVWSANFDHDNSDLISMQESVAIEIARALETTMDAELLARFVSSGTASVPAFEAYLRGLADYNTMLQTGNVDTYTESIRWYQRAVEIDPAFGLAWFQIAQYWGAQASLTGILGGGVPETRAEMLERYNAAIEAAIEHANDPVSRLGMRASRTSMRMEMRKALQLNTEYLAQRPNDWRAQNLQMILLSQLNRYDELKAYIEQLFTDGERELVTVARALLVVSFSGDAALTEKLAAQASERIGNNAIGLYQLHRAWLWSGNIARARQTYEKLASSEMPEANLYLARLRQLCAEGRTAEADELYADGTSEFRQDLTAVWAGHTIIGAHAAATEAWRFADEGDLTQFDGVLQYPMFVPQAYPNLVAFLERHGNEPGPVRKVPFRCYD